MTLSFHKVDDGGITKNVLAVKVNHFIKKVSGLCLAAFRNDQSVNLFTSLLSF